MFYSVKEGFSGLLRAKFSSIVATTVICLSLLLIGFFLIFISNAKRLIDSVQKRIELEVFIDNSFEETKIDILKNQISSMSGVESATFTSKEDAAEIFKQQFNEDIFEILDENPLPASFQIILNKEFRSAEKANQLISEIEKLEGVDDIEFRKDILVLLEKYLNVLIVAVGAIGALLVIGSVILISNTIKLIIIAREHIIETMKLVGATRGFIRRPLIVEGVIQGVGGSILAILFFYIILRISHIEIPNVFTIDREIYFIIFGLGIFLGFVGSLFAIQRFLKF